MQKKFIALILSIVLVLSMAACGQSAAPAASESETEIAATGSATETSTAASAEASTGASTEISAEASTEVSAEASSAESQTKPEAAQETTQPSVEGAGTTNADAGTVPADNTTAGFTEKQLTIALFGLDANKNPSGDTPESWAKLMRQFRSDCTMIANINLETGDVKLVSVYRDTFLNIGDDRYQKCNAAYAKGGATQAVEMLNTNLDLNIEYYIAVSYHGLMELIDGLGGITVDVEQAALNEINGYQNTIVIDLGLSGYTPVTESGPQTLNGLQATAYCRLRHDFPRGDLDRAAHQRKVLKAIEVKAKQTDAATLAALFAKVFTKINTNLDMETLAELVANIENYSISGEAGFPADDMVKIATLGKAGSCVVPIDLERNVIRLHQFLYGQEDYTPSQTVKDINATIIEKASPYVSFE